MDAADQMLRPQWLDEYESLAEGVTRFRIVGDRSKYIAIIPFLYTTAIIWGSVKDQSGYKDRWCYDSFDKALVAFNAWDGLSREPEGWHRHPKSGRRRPSGLKENEYINP